MFGRGKPTSRATLIQTPHLPRVARVRGVAWSILGGSGPLDSGSNPDGPTLGHHEWFRRSKLIPEGGADSHLIKRCSKGATMGRSSSCWLWRAPKIALRRAAREHAAVSRAFPNDIFQESFRGPDCVPRFIIDHSIGGTFRI